MDQKSELQLFYKKLNELQSFLLSYIDDCDDDSENKFHQLIDYIKNEEINKDTIYLREFLHLINEIANNHHRKSDFRDKIEKILQIFSEDIKQTFSSSEIMSIFRKNRYILLILIHNKIVEFDEHEVKDAIETPIWRKIEFYSFFYTEIKSFLNAKQIEILKDYLIKMLDNLDDFEEKIKLGENESYICSLIRNDSVEEFIKYVNKTNVNLSEVIVKNKVFEKKSYFETNSFLRKQPNITMIEYAAFFGSIQIYRFLRMNNVQLTPSLWIYAIHSNNPELIHLLEEDHVEPEDKSFFECYIEAIKCHHNDVAVYIKENLLDIKSNDLDFQIILTRHKYHNFYDYNSIDDLLLSFKESANYQANTFFHFCCKYDFPIIVDFFLKILIWISTK